MREFTPQRSGKPEHCGGCLWNNCPLRKDLSGEVGSESNETGSTGKRVNDYRKMKEGIP
jgi:hypothetical protein